MTPADLLPYLRAAYPRLNWAVGPHGDCVDARATTALTTNVVMSIRLYRSSLGWQLWFPLSLVPGDTFDLPSDSPSSLVDSVRQIAHEHWVVVRDTYRALMGVIDP